MAPHKAKLGLQPFHPARRGMTLRVSINDMWRIQSLAQTMAASWLAPS